MLYSRPPPSSPPLPPLVFLNTPGVSKARECLAELKAACALLLLLPDDEVIAGTSECDDDAEGVLTTGSSGHASSDKCCSGGRLKGNCGHGQSPSHSHEHDHHHHQQHHCHECGVKNSISGSRSEGVIAGGCAPGISENSGSSSGCIVAAEAATKGGEKSRKREKGGKIGLAEAILRRAKVECRVAEGTCLLRGGRAAEATEALRDLLLEVGWFQIKGAGGGGGRGGGRGGVIPP